MIPRWRWIGLALLVASCDREPAPARSEAPPATREDSRGRIVFLGTSLTAGLGLDPSQAYPALLQQKIDSAGLPYVTVNAGVSGETSAGARRRVDWLMRQPAAVLVVETGANDGLRGLDPGSLEANIQAIIHRAREQSPPPEIILLGMRAPPNLGRDYDRRFQRVYTDLAKRNGIRLVPFLLEGVAGIDSLNQADGIHPTPAGQRRMADAVWGELEGALQAGKTEGLKAGR